MHGYTEFFEKCPECGSKNIIYSQKTDELVCYDCGTVIQEHYGSFAMPKNVLKPLEPTARSRRPRSYNQELTRALRTTKVIKDKDQSKISNNLSTIKTYINGIVSVLQEKYSISDAIVSKSYSYAESFVRRCVRDGKTMPRGAHLTALACVELALEKYSFMISINDFKTIMDKLEVKELDKPKDFFNRLTMVKDVLNERPINDYNERILRKLDETVNMVLNAIENNGTRLPPNIKNAVRVTARVIHQKPIASSKKFVTIAVASLIKVLESKGMNVSLNRSDIFSTANITPKTVNELLRRKEIKSIMIV